MGEDRLEHTRRQKSLADLRLQAAVSATEVDKSVLDERPLGQVKVINLLVDLTSRAYSEEDALLARQRSDASLQVMDRPKHILPSA